VIRESQQHRGLALGLLRPSESRQGHLGDTQHDQDGEPGIFPKSPAILGFITSSEDFLRNSLFAWTKIPSRKGPFKLLIASLVHQPLGTASANDNA
jgi:hypothetical protein